MSIYGTGFPLIQGVMFDPNDSNTNAGGGADGTNTNQNVNDAAGGGKQPVDGQNGGGNNGGNNGGKKVYTFEEDRSDWVPRTRLNEHNPKFTQRLTAAEQRAQTLEAELTAERNRVRALAGLETPSAEEAQRKEVKALILEMFPELGEIPKLRDQNQQALSQAEQAQVAHWERHSSAMISDLETEVASALGVEKLNERQVKALRRAYTEEAQAAVNARFQNIGGQWVLKEGYDFSNDFMSRHERGDKALLKQFAKDFVGDWFEPARRHVTSQAVRRGSRPVPSGSRSGQPVTKTPEINYNSEAEFKKALLDARRGGGND